MFVDVAQFAIHPVATGIQRTLLSLSKYWPDDGPQADFGLLVPGTTEYAIVPTRAFFEGIDWLFGNTDGARPRGPDPSRDLYGRLEDTVIDRIAPAIIPDRYEGYLLPEITAEDRVLDTLSMCLSRLGRRCMAIVYDPLPQTHPEVFRGPHQSQTSRYYLTLTSVDSLAFISDETKREFEQRMRRAPVPNALRLRLGADGLGTSVGEVPDEVNFVVPATVEPRKRHELILDTFERLWGTGRRYQLRFLGTAGWLPDSTIRRFRRRAEEQPLFEWHEHASDAEFRRMLASATGAIYVSDLEGYGLPPLEALALGCPVIVSANLPALEGLPKEGQIRLEAVSESALATAIDQLAERSRNAALRQEIRHLALPSWRDVALDVAAWAHRTLTEPSPAGA